MGTRTEFNLCAPVALHPVRHAARDVASDATWRRPMLRGRQHSPLGLWHEMQPPGLDVASAATPGDEGTRGCDERTGEIVDRIRRFDDRTRALANEPDTTQALDVKEDSVAGAVVSRDERTEGAFVPDEPERRLLSGSACDRNSIRQGSLRGGGRPAGRDERRDFRHDPGCAFWASVRGFEGRKRIGTGIAAAGSARLAASSGRAEPGAGRRKVLVAPGHISIRLPITMVRSGGKL